MNFTKPLWTVLHPLCMTIKGNDTHSQFHIANIHTLQMKLDYTEIKLYRASSLDLQDQYCVLVSIFKLEWCWFFTTEGKNNVEPCLQSQKKVN